MRLKERREAAGLTMSELAKAIGTTPPNIFNYESGKYRPKYELACKLAEFFGCTFEDIMDGFRKEG